MTITALNWTPEPQLLKQLAELAEKRGQPLDTLLTEAVILYLNAQTSPLEPEASKPDPLIGLFAGSSNLATESKAILEQEISSSGWTWK